VENDAITSKASKVPSACVPNPGSGLDRVGLDESLEARAAAAVPACVGHHQGDGHRLAADGALLSPQPQKRQELEGGKASGSDAKEGRRGRDACDLEEDGPQQHDVAKDPVEVCCGQEIGEEQVDKVSKCEGGAAKSQKGLHDQQDLPKIPAFCQDGEESAG